MLGNEAAPREGCGQLRARRHEAQVAIELEAQADAGDRAVDAGDDRLGNGKKIAVALRQIVVDLRLPRTVSALLVGASLGVAGALLQGALANPLASPDVIGVTGGAGFS